jgi:K+-sensing histidine kinase KdpD
LKKIITLVAALAGFSLAILIPVVVSSAATVTTCPGGASLSYCSVSTLNTWTVSQKSTTVTAAVKLPGGSSTKLLGLSVPKGVKVPSIKPAESREYLTFSSEIHKYLTFKSGKKTIRYTVTTATSSSFTVKLKSAEKKFDVVLNAHLFKTKDRKFTATLAVKTTNGTTYLETFKVKI